MFFWEPRGKWPPALIQELCQELNLLHVVDPFTQTAVTHGIKYYRLHGRGRKPQKYNLDEMKELQASIMEDEQTYILFNNVYMLDDAKEFIHLLRKLKLSKVKYEL